MSKEKDKSLTSKLILKKELVKLKNKLKNKKIVLCHGVYDVIHLGHLNHFKSAKKNCDFLIVSITADQFIKKGPGRPLFDTRSRIQMLSQLEIVDYIYVSDNETSEGVIDLLKPNFYAKGIEYKNKNLQESLFLKEKKALIRNKVKLIFTPDEKFSSTKIINILEKNTSTRQFGIFDDDQIEFLRKLKVKYSYDYIEKIINKILNIKFNVIGEPLIDEYIFTKSFSTSSKSPTIATEFVRKEFHPGGAIFVAMIAREFSKNVSFISYSNNNNIKKYFNLKNFKQYLINTNSKIPKITRYVNLNYNYKMFQVYEFEKFLHSKNSLAFLKKNSSQSVRNICIDFGFGFFDNKVMNYLKTLKKKTNN